MKKILFLLIFALSIVNAQSKDEKGNMTTNVNNAPTKNNETQYKYRPKTISQIFTECGIGGLIAQSFHGDDTARLMALITNVSSAWFYGFSTFLAISSGITSPGTCANDRKRIALYMLDTYEHLESDIAMGEGIYLEGLLELKLVSVDKLKNITKDIVSLDNYNALSKYQKADKLFVGIYQ